MMDTFRHLCFLKQVLCVCSRGLWFTFLFGLVVLASDVLEYNHAGHFGLLLNNVGTTAAGCLWNDRIDLHREIYVPRKLSHTDRRAGRIKTTKSCPIIANSCNPR